MESLKAIFFKPDPAAQLRACNALIRKNTRELDREILKLKSLETSTKTTIQKLSTEGQRHPARAKDAAQSTRILARELIRIRKHCGRLVTSKAQLESVRMQVQEAFAVRKIEGSIRASTGVMRDVNALIRLPQLSETMRALGNELVKAGVIEEMVGDMMPVGEEGMMEEEGEMEVEEGEVERVLGEVLGGRVRSEERRQPQKQQQQQQPVQREEEGEVQDEENAELTLEQMRGRLEALKS
ncbi:MAG: Vacuolar protein-sorting-associated protein 24 [Peltula sp. TS41687]|nr:MAG: Vacuolar protein-sorting-associated protein 24 [Peltula sp. TS41687]